MKEVWLILYLSPYSIHYVALFAKCFYFYFIKNLIVGFVIDRADSKNTDIGVNFSG